MIKKNYKKYKIGSKYSNIYNRQLNKIIVVLSILIIILIIKTINSSTSNNIIEIIEKNIYYSFSWKRDGKKVTEYMKNIIENTMESIEVFNIEINQKGSF